MICPQCETAGERSRVYPGSVDVTLMDVQEYWDEDGNYVVDDPNTVTRAFSCSNRHNWPRGQGARRNNDRKPSGYASVI